MAPTCIPPFEEEWSYHFGHLHSRRYIIAPSLQGSLKLLSLGKIMRLTIPKSQGKQPYYDARKSSWGDLFPHPPKNRPLERYQPLKQSKGDSATGSDIGKRRDLHKKRERASYNGLGEGLKEKKRMSKREYAKIRGEKVWNDIP